MNTTFKTFAEAEAAGFRRVNRKADKDISGSHSIGYRFQNTAGQKTVTVSLTDEINQMGQAGCYVAMFPPVKTSEHDN